MTISFSRSVCFGFDILLLFLLDHFDRDLDSTPAVGTAENKRVSHFFLVAFPVSCAAGFSLNSTVKPDPFTSPFVQQLRQKNFPLQPFGPCVYVTSFISCSPQLGHLLTRKSARKRSNSIKNGSS